MQKRIFKVGFKALIVVLFGLAVGFFSAEAQDLNDYDDFDECNYLDPILWHAVEGDFKGGLDVIRKIDTGKKDKGELWIGATAYSSEGGSYEFGTRFNNPDGGGPHNMTAMEAEDKIIECAFNACGSEWDQVANPTFEMIGSFFSTGLGDPNCSKDDWDEIHALIGLQPKLDMEGNVFDVMASIFGMPNYVSYDISHNLGDDLGWTVEKGETVKLGLRWNQATHSFIFQFNNDTHEISYYDWLTDITDTDPPCGGFKSIRPMIGLAQSCRSMGSIELLIDNVRIENAPPWSTGP